MFQASLLFQNSLLSAKKNHRVGAQPDAMPKTLHFSGTSNTVRALNQLSLPVAVDGDDDDEQHGHHDGGDDDVERQVVLLLILHRAHNPLAFAKLDLCMNAERKRNGDNLNVLPACAGPPSC